MQNSSSETTDIRWNNTAIKLPYNIATSRFVGLLAKAAHNGEKRKEIVIEVYKQLTTDFFLLLIEMLTKIQAHSQSSV